VLHYIWYHTVIITLRKTPPCKVGIRWKVERLKKMYEEKKKNQKVKEETKTVPRTIDLEIILFIQS
jgi:7,8-dihydro-6-hydroxymethylpterin-pyrophosphokinase